MPVKICKYLKPLILGFDNFKKSNGYCTVHGRSFFISQKKIVWFIWHFFKKKSLGHVYTQICTGIMRNHRSLTLFVNLVQISCQYCFFSSWKKLITRWRIFLSYNSTFDIKQKWPREAHTILVTSLLLNLKKTFELF